MMNRGIMDAKRDDAINQDMAVDAVSVKGFFREYCAAG